MSIKNTFFVKLIRAIRVTTGLLLICAAPPFAFLFPFLFDDPQMENPLVRYSIFAFIAVVPVLFILTSKRTKTAVSQGNLDQGLFYSALPLLGLLIVTLSWSPVLQSIPDLTSYGPLHGQGETSLSIQLPTGCKREDHYFRGNFPYASYNGTWLVSKEAVSFKCNSTVHDGYLNIRPAVEISSISKVQTSNFRKTIIGDNIFEVHSARWEEGPLFEVIEFTAEDGVKVTAKREFNKKNVYWVVRNLDESFKVDYTMRLPTDDHTALLNFDRQVIRYVKSIARRSN